MIPPTRILHIAHGCNPLSGCFPGHTYIRYMIQSDSQGRPLVVVVVLWPEKRSMHVSEARHCVSHCMQGRPLFHGLAALLQAHKLPEARQELRAATYLFCQQQQSDRNVTPFTTERPALWNILRDESKPCCRAGNLFFFALNAERVLLADSRASRPPLSRASQSVPALTLPSKNGPAHKC